MYASLLALLDKLLYVMLAWKRASDSKNAQEERNEIENNPAGWFTTHFGGGVQHSSTESNEQTDSNKADAGSSDKN